MQLEHILVKLAMNAVRPLPQTVTAPTQEQNLQAINSRPEQWNYTPQLTSPQQRVVFGPKPSKPLLSTYAGGGSYQGTRVNPEHRQFFGNYTIPMEEAITRTERNTSTMDPTLRRNEISDFRQKAKGQGNSPFDWRGHRFISQGDGTVAMSTNPVNDPDNWMPAYNADSRKLGPGESDYRNVTEDDSNVIYSKHDNLRQHNYWEGKEREANPGYVNPQSQALSRQLANPNSAQAQARATQLAGTTTPAQDMSDRFMRGEQLNYAKLSPGEQAGVDAFLKGHEAYADQVQGRTAQPQAMVAQAK